MAKIFYSIGEVAELLDIPVSTVRFWEKSFDILRPHKTGTGHRKFTAADIENLKIIYHLVKEKGMTLEGARQRLRENPAGVSRDQEIVDRLLRMRALLAEIRQELGEDDNEVYRGEAYVQPEDIGIPTDAEPLQEPQEREQGGDGTGYDETGGDGTDCNGDGTGCDTIPRIIEQTLF